MVDETSPLHSKPLNERYRLLTSITPIVLLVGSRLEMGKSGRLPMLFTDICEELSEGSKVYWLERR